MRPTCPEWVPNTRKQEMKNETKDLPKLDKPPLQPTIQPPQTNRHTNQEEIPSQYTTHRWPMAKGKTGPYYLAQLSRLWSGIWKGKQPKSNKPAALSTMHQSIAALLAMGTNMEAFESKEELKLVSKVHSPVRIYPNPLYDPCPRPKIKWLYTIPRAEMILN